MTPEQLAAFLNYGVLGLFTVLWLTDRIHTRSRTDRAEQAADNAIKQVTLLVGAIDRLSASFESWRTVERRDGPR